MYNNPRTDDWSNFSDGDWSNAIGTCGVRPLGIGKKGKEKLAQWQACRAQKKDGTSSDSTLDTSFLDPMLNKGNQKGTGDSTSTTTTDSGTTSPDSGTASSGFQMPMWGWVGIGVAGIGLLSVGAYFLFRKKK